MGKSKARQQADAIIGLNQIDAGKAITVCDSEAVLVHVYAHDPRKHVRKCLDRRARRLGYTSCAEMVESRLVRDADTKRKTADKAIRKARKKKSKPLKTELEGKAAENEKHNRSRESVRRAWNPDMKSVDWSDVPVHSKVPETQVCPVCGSRASGEEDIATVFGLRREKRWPRDKGPSIDLRAQSLCRVCRSAHKQGPERIEEAKKHARKVALAVSTGGPMPPKLPRMPRQKW